MPEYMVPALSAHPTRAMGSIERTNPMQRESAHLRHGNDDVP